MLDGAHGKPDYRVMPRTTFTDPELAGVGLSEDGALAAGYEVEVRRYVEVAPLEPDARESGDDADERTGSER